MDALVLILLTGAAASAFQVVLHWDPGNTDRRQLRLRSRQETWSLATTLAAWVYLATGFLLIWSLTTVLPGLVPGAMCGTGVLEACRPYGFQMLAFRFLATVGLMCWQRLETLNRSDPLAGLTSTNARILLMLMPLVVLGALATYRALTGFDTGQPVDCCTALYDRIAAAPGAVRSTFRHPLLAPALFGVTTLLLIIMAIPRPQSFRTTTRQTARLVLSAIWLVTAAVTLVRHLAPYHYEVLHHYCPWCLFLPEHDGIGFPLLFFWGLVAVEAPVQWALARARTALPERLPACTTLMRGSRRRLLAGLLGFMLLAVGPALWWRWQFGLWIDG
jgi:hypothetical protein